MTGTVAFAELQIGRLLGHAAHKVSLRCAHGESTYFLLPGSDPTANAAALDLLWVRHIGRHGCGCERALTSDSGAQPD